MLSHDTRLLSVAGLYTLLYRLGLSHEAMDHMMAFPWHLRMSKYINTHCTDSETIF